MCKMSYIELRFNIYIYIYLFIWVARNFEVFGGVRWVRVVVGRRDRHFRFPHTEFSLGIDFR